MSNQFVRYGFISGELAPDLYGRTELEKFDLGVGLAYNWLVNYSGGAQCRAGSQFGDYIMSPDKPTKFIPFAFSPDIENTYVILLGSGYIRFIQNNAYVLEANQTITGVTKAAQGVVTANAHGYADGDWIYLNGIDGMIQLNGRLVVVSDKTPNTFKIKDVHGDYINTSTYTAYISGGRANRIYTLTHTYGDGQVTTVRATQLRDTVRLTHPKHKIRNLKRINHANWTFTVEEIGSKIDPPTGVSASAQGQLGDLENRAGMRYVVTAVDHDDNESVASLSAAVENRNMTLYNNSQKVQWQPKENVHHFNVYRTILKSTGMGSEELPSPGSEFGYVGRAYGLSFEDGNIIADFARTPPVARNPFVDAGIDYVNITNGGTGYDDTTVLNVTDADGSGALLHPVVENGVITAVIVADAGEGYTNPSIAATVGTGAVFDAVLKPASGNFPRVSAVFQQRQIYAGTENDPLTVFGSKPGKFSNFDESSIILDSDGYEHEIDASLVAPILHLIPLRGGLMIMGASGLWMLSGENGLAVTPKNPLVDPQSYIGCENVVPVRIGPDILYIEDKGFTARYLSYKDINKVYTGEDISILSSHFFHQNARVRNMAYASGHEKIAWCQRDGGSILAFTILREQNVYAWTQCWTRGKYTDVVTLPEGNFDAVYVAVERTLNGKTVKMFERFVDQKTPEFVEDAWHVDCGLALGTVKPDATLQLMAATGTDVEAVANPGVFGGDVVNKIIRVAGAKARVTTRISSTTIRVDIIRPANKLVPFTDPPMPVLAKSGEWTRDVGVSRIDGLWHLIGETVSYLADGNVGTAVVDSDGGFDVEGEPTRLVAGLGYRCKLKTLPIATQTQPIEGRRKTVVGVAINLLESRGLKVGGAEDQLYEMTERANEIMGEPIELQTGTKYELVQPPGWEVESAVWLVQENPLPATVRALVLDLEVGDDTT